MTSMLHVTQAAVWLQYAECLNSLGDLTAAAHAFEQVLQQVPTHNAARLSLSAIQQQLGKPEEAINVLQSGGFLLNIISQIFDCKL